jgi:hypothetical protein
MINCAGKFNAERSGHGVRFKAPNALMQGLTPYLVYLVPCDLTPYLGFGGEEVCAGPHTVETGKPYDPLHIGALGVYGVVVKTEHLADFIEEFW